MSYYDELKARRLIIQVTSKEEVSRLVNEGKVTFYIGFDLTMDSLRVGHFMALCLTKCLQDADSKPIALVGGDTSVIGDPSGRTGMRSMMTIDRIDRNCKSFKRQMSCFIEFGEGKARMVNDADWLRNLNYIGSIHDIGPHFSVNNMLRAEYYGNRMEKGSPSLEFSCMLMQAFSSCELFQRYDYNIQFGDDDQWSNILTGTGLVYRKLGKDAHAMTITFLSNSEGEKTGKTVDGAIWLDSNKILPFVSYQYWRNVDDQDVLKYPHMPTFLPLLWIDEVGCWEGAKLDEARDISAYELTTPVHDRRKAKKARKGVQALFAGGDTSTYIPATKLTDENFSEGEADILTLLVRSGLTASRPEARRNVQQGGVSLDSKSVKDVAASYGVGFFVGESKLLECGKKNFVKLVKT